MSVALARELILPLTVTAGLLLFATGCWERAGFPTRPGVHRGGRWTYSYAVMYPARSNEIRVGKLYYDGQLVTGSPGTVTNTQIGKLRFFNTSHNQGWLNTLAANVRVFDQMGRVLPNDVGSNPVRTPTIP